MVARLSLPILSLSNYLLRYIQASNFDCRYILLMGYYPNRDNSYSWGILSYVADWPFLAQ